MNSTKHWAAGPPIFFSFFSLLTFFFFFCAILRIASRGPNAHLLVGVKGSFYFRPLLTFFGCVCILDRYLFVALLQRCNWRGSVIFFFLTLFGFAFCHFRLSQLSFEIQEECCIALLWWWTFTQAGRKLCVFAFVSDAPSAVLAREEIGLFLLSRNNFQSFLISFDNCFAERSNYNWESGCSGPFTDKPKLKVTKATSTAHRITFLFDLFFNSKPAISKTNCSLVRTCLWQCSRTAISCAGDFLHSNNLY